MRHKSFVTIYHRDKFLIISHSASTHKHLSKTNHNTKQYKRNEKKKAIQNTLTNKQENDQTFDHQQPKHS